MSLRQRFGNTQPHAMILAELEQARARGERTVPREALPELISGFTAGQIELAVEELKAAGLVSQIFDGAFKLDRVLLRDQ